MLQGPQLIVTHGAIVMGFVQLRLREAKHEVRGTTVAGHAFRAAWIMPNLPPDGARRVVILEGEFLVAATGLDQRSVRLRLIPTIGISNPLALLTGEYAGLDPLARRWIARLAFERQRLNQHSAIRGVRTAGTRVVHAGLARQRDEALDVRAVGPTRSIHRVRNQTRVHLMSFRGNKESRLTETSWEFGRGALRRGPHQLVNAAGVVGNQEAPLMIHRKGRDLQSGSGQFPVPDHLRAIVTRAPNGAARIVAIYIDAVEIGKRLAVVNDSASQGPRFGVVMLNGGGDGGCGTQLPVEVERMAAFINTPTVILAASNEVRCFPEVLTVIARPD